VTDRTTAERADHAHGVRGAQFFRAGLRNGLIATLGLGALIVIGSRNLADFDSALVGYTFACLLATFGIVYRYTVWLSKPPTRMYWRRGIEVLCSPRRWRRLGRPRLLAGALWSKIIAQRFILRRGRDRWLAHMLIAWGCMLAAAVTFPLVFGWLHFEQGAIEPAQTYRVMVFGFRVGEVPIDGVAAWGMFHALVIAAFMVIPGVMLAMWRRMRDSGALAVQRFGRDFLPLLLLFAVSVTGLLLWVSYEWLHGYYYSVLAQVHALTVIGTLIYLPFGKLFHVFQRPASLGITFYKAAGAQGAQAVCPVTHERFAPALQVEDLGAVLPEVGFDYRARTQPGPSWNQLSPRGRRVGIARAHAAVTKKRSPSWPA
jgi:nitrate reductase gamma subunit